MVHKKAILNTKPADKKFEFQLLIESPIISGKNDRKSQPKVSFTNADDFKTESVHFNWALDFDGGKIDGTVELKVNVLKNTDKFILDTRFIDVKRYLLKQLKPKIKFI